MVAAQKDLCLLVDDRASAYRTDGIRATKGEGLWITDADGNRFLDGCAGTFNIGLGFKHPKVVAAIEGVLSKGILNGSTTLRNELVEDAERELVSIAPTGLDRCHMKGCTGGSTAVEQAVRHAWANTERQGLITFNGSHHGQTIATSLLSGMDFRKKRLGGVSFPVSAVPAPDCYRCPYGKSQHSCRVECADEVVALVESRRNDPTQAVAAMVAEPIMGAGGGIVPHRRYWPKISEQLRKRNVLLVFDEVQTFGRTGEFFASDYFDATPDMIALAKGISGIGVPGTGALLLPQSLCILDSGERSLTWGGSNIAAAAISATLREMKKPGFMQQVARVGYFINTELQRMCAMYDFVGCVRGVGLMTGIEIVESKQSKKPNVPLAARIIELARESGLLLRQSHYDHGAFVKVRPSLTITMDEARELCKRLERALKRCMH
jgi:4-aminobutyrate aminotransferase-like enzyme